MKILPCCLLILGKKVVCPFDESCRFVIIVSPSAVFGGVGEAVRDVVTVEIRRTGNYKNRYISILLLPFAQKGHLQPADTLAVALSHNDGAHEDLDGADALERDLALARGLVQAELVPQLVLGDGVGVVDLVAEDEEGSLLEVLHGEERIELGLGLQEALWVFGVDEEDDA